MTTRSFRKSTLDPEAAFLRQPGIIYMFLWPFYFALQFALPQMSVQAQKLISPGYQFNSDPTCREINGTFYLFTTHDPFTVQFETDNSGFGGMYDFHAYSTEDFDHWVDHGSILSTHDANWHAGTAIWDGDAGISANHKYYAYAPFRVSSDSEKDEIFQIGVLESTSITGPYTDSIGKAMTNTDGTELVGLSPTVVFADNGDPYLLWGPDAGGARYVRMAKLKPNMTELAEPMHEIRVQLKDSEGQREFFESPILFKRDGLWYMTYMSNIDRNRKSSNYPPTDPKGFYVRYATSKNMLGPYTENPRTAMYPGGGGVQNNHQGICSYKGQWYIAYHTNYERDHRQVAVTKLNFNEDGSIVPIYPDEDPGAGTPGVSELTLDAFAAKREAQEFHARLNSDPFPRPGGGFSFAMKDDGYLRFDAMDFGKGGANFRIVIRHAGAHLKNGYLRIHIDSPAGRVIGQVKIDADNNSEGARVFTGPLTTVTGVHSVYLTANGSEGDSDGHLYQVDWFTFEGPRT
jgi:arabinoxylan arabinofuranohydrolase